MKKAMFFVMTLVVSAFFVPNVFAATSPEKFVTSTGHEVVFANGTAITIEAREDNQEGATIKWDGGSIDVGVKSSIFGGGHNHSEKIEATSIIMNSGTVYSIFGGSLHNGKVGTTYIEVNGGRVGYTTPGTAAVMGGGYYNSYISTSHCQTWGAAHTHGALNEVTQATSNLSPVSVDDATIVINGGNLDGTMVYGGGGGYSNTTNVSITLNSFEGTLLALVAGGSNGYTKDAEVVMNDGKVETLLAVNRGGMDTANVEVTGGEVTNAFATTETSNNETPTINHGLLSITGGKVENVEAGKVAGDAASVYYVESAVENIDTNSFKQDLILPFVKITFTAMGQSESTTVPVGTTLLPEDIEDLKEELTKILGGTGYKFDNFYLDEKFTQVYDMTKPFDKDITIYINLVEEKVDTTTNPDTADINIVSVVIALLLGIGGIAYTVRKRRFN